MPAASEGARGAIASRSALQDSRPEAVVRSFQQTGIAWLKTGIVAGACLLVGFGNSAAFAGGRKAAPKAETVAVVEAAPAPEASATSSSASGPSAVVALDWQRLAREAQASPYALPVAAVILLVVGAMVLGGGGKKEAGAAAAVAAAPAADPAAGGGSSGGASDPAATAPAAAPAAAPAPAAPTVVTTRPSTISLNINMGSPAAKPAAPAPAAPAAPAAKPAAVAKEAVPVKPAAPPAPAPAAEAKDTRPAAKDWIAAWRKTVTPAAKPVPPSPPRPPTPAAAVTAPAAKPAAAPLPTAAELLKQAGGKATALGGVAAKAAEVISSSDYVVYKFGDAAGPKAQPGFGAFVSDGLVPAMGALLNGGKGSSSGKSSGGEGR
ncbi:hypothetical protein GPECTOR_155g84 [Gonium pectorale]|uniref:Uncharacterized protein n=1 Tax=Gonium pectorale TaxID=33097 RepID=A0A150FXM1_GONPE|nr:hypothetical protein GPECTOR_155g84 [Gonium pectorale]|eukprot:KXZ42374.1 hypothetical protein GPECTOR_155g84 [Gonium pectorale]